GAGPGRLLLGRGDGQPPPGEHHGALVLRGGDLGGAPQGEHADRLIHDRDRPRGGDAPAAWDVCLMRYHVVAVGRVRDAALRAACDGYLERLRRYTKVAEREVRDEARILEAIPGGWGPARRGDEGGRARAVR